MAERKIEIVLDEHEDKEGDAFDGFTVTLKAYEDGVVVKESQPQYMGLYSGHPNFEKDIGKLVSDFIVQMAYPEFVFD